MYPAIQVKPALTEAILEKSNEKVRGFKINEIDQMTDFSLADWLDDQVNVTSNWAPLLSTGGSVEGVIGLQCPLSTKMSCLSKAGAAQQNTELQSF